MSRHRAHYDTNLPYLGYDYHDREMYSRSEHSHVAQETVLLLQAMHSLRWSLWGVIISVAPLSFILAIVFARIIPKLA